MGIVCIDETEVIQAICHTNTQPENSIGGIKTYDIGVEDDLANGVCSAGYQEIDPVLEIVVEI